MTRSNSLDQLPPRGMSWVGLVGAKAPELLPKHNDDFSGSNVVIIGSFKGWETQIKPTRQRLQTAGFYPLAPHGNAITHYVGTDGTFEVVDADAASIELMEKRLGRVLSKQQTAGFLEALFCAAIRESDFVYVAGLPRAEIDDGDYIGLQVAVELGVALSHGRVYGTKISPSLDEREGWHSNFAAYVSMIEVATPEELGQRYKRGETL